MNNETPAIKPVIAAQASLGKDLLIAMVEAIRKTSPAAWSSMAQEQQQDVIDGLAHRIQVHVVQAVSTLAQAEHIVIEAHVDSVTFKDGVKATLTAMKGDGAHQLADAQGSSVLVVITDATKYLETMDQVRGDADQRSLPGLEA
jgi:hypothetical protein